MTNSDLKGFADFLLNKKKYIIYAPVKKGGRVLIRQILDSKNFSLAKERPLYPFKEYLLPSKQAVFDFFNEEEKSFKDTNPRQVLFGVTIFDLKAIALLAQVFEKDSYFQNIISSTILIGQSPVPDDSTFYEKYEENVLEHIKFDIFLESRFDREDFRIFTGSKHGQRLLNEFGVSDFEHIEYAGAVPEEGLSDFHKVTREKIKKSYGSAIWKELGRRCLGCEKCTLVCPTCFCFKIYDEHNIQSSSNSPVRQRFRAWDSCFSSEFSEISGGAKFLKTIQDRIYNWYDHKFVRIPTEYNLPGCVGCGRCSEVCPAGINIKDVIAKIQKTDFKQNPMLAAKPKTKKVLKPKKLSASGGRNPKKPISRPSKKDKGL